MPSTPGEDPTDLVGLPGFVWGTLMGAHLVSRLRQPEGLPVSERLSPQRCA